MSYYPVMESLSGRYLCTVREETYKKTHEIYSGAPCEWSAARGATHTLYCGEGPGRGTRPVKLLKTVLYLGTTEDNETIVWEKWHIKRIF